MPKRSVPKDNEKIKALRASLGYTRLQFSQALDVTQPTISAWENGSEIPSREAYVRMGNIAQYPDDLWFWEKGGVNIGSAKVSAHRDLQREAPTVPGFALVPMKTMSEKGFEEVGKSIAVSQEFMENPFATICLVINKEIGGEMFSEGDWVLLDPLTEKNRASLQRQKVLFKFGPYGQRTPDHGRHWPAPGHAVGTLTFQKLSNDDVSWMVKLDGDLVGYLEDGPEARISLYGGCEILGRVACCVYKAAGGPK